MRCQRSHVTTSKNHFCYKYDCQSLPSTPLYITDARFLFQLKIDQEPNIWIMVADGRCTALPVRQAGKVLKTRVPLTNTHIYHSWTSSATLLDWFLEDTLQNIIFPTAEFLFLRERVHAGALIRQNRGWVFTLGTVMWSERVNREVAPSGVSVHLIFANCVS